LFLKAPAGNPGVFSIPLAIYHDTMTTAPKEPPDDDGTGLGGRLDDDSWFDVPWTFRSSDCHLPSPWQEIFGPLRDCRRVDDLTVIGQFGQSIDARIATATGHSKYVNGPAGLAHLHRLRALVDAVVIGIGTALADDPQLTVRRVAGPSPARAVIDPRGRLPPTARVMAADGVRRIVLTSESAKAEHLSGVEIVRLPTTDGHIAPAAILRALSEHGLHWILIEGGADTVSRFLAAHCLDRLHVVIAPIIIGAGPSSVTLPPIARVDDAFRAPIRAHVLGDEVLLDCDLGAQRVAVGVAKMST
jgi:diaminohydroxyphosphoribosylaminopyrimidine deaminase / 5-amino-6-(5-phosphoribosylamino)uracil reductase